MDDNSEAKKRVTAAWPPAIHTVSKMHEADVCLSHIQASNATIGVAIGLLFYLVVAALIRLGVPELSRRYLPAYPPAAEVMIYIGLFVWPCVPAFLVALFCRRQKQRFALGLVIGALVGMVLLFLFAYSFIGITFDE